MLEEKIHPTLKNYVANNPAEKEQTTVMHAGIQLRELIKDPKKNHADLQATLFQMSLLSVEQTKRTALQKEVEKLKNKKEKRQALRKEIIFQLALERRLKAVNEPDPKTGKTALHCAAEIGDIEKMEELINAGANAGLKDNNRCTARTLFYRHYQKMAQEAQIHGEFIPQEKVNAAKKMQKILQALESASKQSNPAKLFDAATDPKKSEFELQAALFDLSSTGDLEKTINDVDPIRKKTALQLASENGDTQKMGMLLDAGADPTLRDDHEKTAEELFPGKCPPNIMKKIQAYQRGLKLSQPLEIPSNAGIDPFADLPNLEPLKPGDLDNLPTPTILVNTNRSEEGTPSLPETKNSCKDLFFHKKDSTGKKLRNLAAQPSEQGLKEMEFFLNELKSQLSPHEFLSLINEKGPDSGKTALDRAAEKGNIETMEMLFNAGAGSSDEDKKNAWHLLQKYLENLLKNIRENIQPNENLNKLLIAIDKVRKGEALQRNYASGISNLIVKALSSSLNALVMAKIIVGAKIPGEAINITVRFNLCWMILKNFLFKSKLISLTEMISNMKTFSTTFLSKKIRENMERPAIEKLIEIQGELEIIEKEDQSNALPHLQNMENILNDFLAEEVAKLSPPQQQGQNLNHTYG